MSKKPQWTEKGSMKLLENVVHFPHPSQIAEVMKSTLVPLVQERKRFFPPADDSFYDPGGVLLTTPPHLSLLTFIPLPL